MKSLPLLSLAIALFSSACATVPGGPTGEGVPPAAWHKQLGGQADQESMAMTVDTNGRVIVVGLAEGWADLGMGYEQARGGQDLFVAAFAANGAPLFTRRFAGSAVLCTDVKADANGNVVVTGFYMSGSLDLGTVLPAPLGGSSAFVAKLGPDGEPLWAMSYGSDGEFSAGGGLAIRPDGKIVVAGSRGEEIFVLQLSPSGEVLFDHHSGLMSSAFAFFSAVESVALDKKGDVFLTGTFESDATFGGMSQEGNGQRIFVAKVSGQDGEPIWVEPFGDPKDFFANEGHAVVVDAAGDAVVSGVYAGEFAPGVEVDGGDVFVVKLSGETGKPIWARGFGDGVGTGLLALDASGNPVLLANTYEQVTMGDTQVPPGTFLVSLSDATGETQRVRAVPEVGSIISGTENGFFGLGALAIGPSNEVVVTTSFFEAADTSLGEMTSAGWGDVLVVGLGKW